MRFPYAALSLLATLMLLGAPGLGAAAVCRQSPSQGFIAHVSRTEANQYGIEQATVLAHNASTGKVDVRKLPNQKKRLTKL